MEQKLVITRDDEMVVSKCKRITLKKGFTLVELILSIAIISIILVSILALYTGGISNIFMMGRKTEATNTAQGFIEAVYSQGTANLATIATQYGSTLVVSYANMNSALYNSANPSKVVFHNLDISGANAKLTVIVFYENGSQFVKLSTLLP